MSARGRMQTCLFPTQSGQTMRYKHIRKAEAEKHSQTGGGTTVFLATGEETDGRVSIYDSQLPKGNSAPWHYHEIDDEIFYVVSGEVEFGIADESFVATSGDLVVAGPNVRRRFEALVDSHLIVVNAPGGPSEGFLRDVMSLKGPPSEADRQRFIDKYKIHILE